MQTTVGLAVVYERRGKAYIDVGDLDRDRSLIKFEQEHARQMVKSVA
jgi:hypothetical protein